MVFKSGERKEHEFLLTKLREEPERFVTLSTFLKEEADKNHVGVSELLDKLAKEFSKENKQGGGPLGSVDPQQFLVRVHNLRNDGSAPIQLDDEAYAEQAELILSIKRSAGKYAIQPETLLNRIEKELYFKALHLGLEDVEDFDRSMSFGSHDAFLTASAGLREACKRLLKAAIVSLEALSSDPLSALMHENRDSRISKEIAGAVLHINKKMEEANELGFSFSLAVQKAVLIKKDDVLEPTAANGMRFIKLLPDETTMYFNGDSDSKFYVRFGDIREMSVVDGQGRKQKIYDQDTFLLVMKEVWLSKGASPFVLAHMLSEERERLKEAPAGSLFGE